MSRIDELLAGIGELERELSGELRKRRDELGYTIRRKRVSFAEDVRARHEELASRISDYVYDSGALIVLTIPLIWSALIPALLLDLVICVYQLVCFPIYGIPKVRRGDYVVIDRHELAYLNWIEKLNCAYCGYFSGLVGFVREVAARTEQYWCPVRHARPVKSVHGRYRHFFEYGDAKGYRDGLADVRGRYDDAE